MPREAGPLGRVALPLAAALSLSACGGAGPPAPREPATGNLTVEGAKALVLGEVMRIYGAEADPVLLRFVAEHATLDGQPVFRVEATVEFTRGERRLAHGWTFWVGFRDDEPAVLRSQGPRATVGTG